jgi:ABC-type lipoprotein release transport system permease subunit
MLHGVSCADARTIAATVIVVAATAVAAGLIPARRASRVEPMDALRVE